MAKTNEEDAALPSGAPDETLSFITALFLIHFPGHGTEFLAGVFNQVRSAFDGTYPGYQGCDTAYHNLAHTCHAAVALVCILDGQYKSRRPPALTSRDYELSLASILLHDIGFLKEIGDNLGTGAKYTLTHVDRGVNFAAKFLPLLGATPDELRQVQLSIRSTAMNVDMDKLPFGDPRERFIGCAVGSADLLGQMAVADYPERLPGLYREFAEADAYAPPGKDGLAPCQSAEDLLRGTRAFYHGYARRMFNREWDGVYQLLKYHFSDGRNCYVEAIEANLDRIDRLLGN